jgi:hypothetical protein
VAPSFDGAIDSRGLGYEWTYVVRGEKNRLEQTAQSLHAQIVGESPLSLDDIFVSNIHRS